mmetsp:Transcript_15200/g.35344  ORF Transcript_15200/g.35344 Transcript_15200/m.35344 type:complete len:354 (-) Transcript_15200:219-1280(-)
MARAAARERSSSMRSCSTALLPATLGACSRNAERASERSRSNCPQSCCDTRGVVYPPSSRRVSSGSRSSERRAAAFSEATRSFSLTSHARSPASATPSSLLPAAPASPRDAVAAARAACAASSAACCHSASAAPSMGNSVSKRRSAAARNAFTRASTCLRHSVSHTLLHASLIEGTCPSLTAPTYDSASENSIGPESWAPWMSFGFADENTRARSAFICTANSGRSTSSPWLQRSCRRDSSSTGRTSGKQSRSWKKARIIERMRFLPTTLSEKPLISRSAVSRYSLEEMSRPFSSTSSSEKSRTTHRNLGKCDANWLPSSSPPSASETRMNFVKLTTSERFSTADSLMLPTLL